jgi:hypothetical protein
MKLKIHGNVGCLMRISTEKIVEIEGKMRKIHGKYFSKSSQARLTTMTDSLAAILARKRSN